MADESMARINAYLEEIAERLWGERAVVMIGSGFSRNAEAIGPSSARLPDWNELGDIFYRKLNGRNPREDERYLSVLKLAGQVGATLGRPALDSLLREAIPDLDYEPSALHRELLELPWKDVFTTNYDTLLERARASVPLRHYEVVKSNSDLLYAKEPRIVKLHGTLPSAPFVITEEDYRTYPRDNEPFVNTVRQSLLENTMCLIGFSGDDPNFQQWIGWIRDQFGHEKAPKIYLVGVLSGLSEGERKLLEARNIVVVDLASLSEDHGVALARLIAFLRGRRPRAADWPKDGSRRASGSPAGSVEELGELARRWRQERLAYPGWVVMPRDRRNIVWAATAPLLGQIVWAVSAEGELGGTVDFDLAFEVAWRVERCLCPLADELSSVIERVVKKYCGKGFKDLPEETWWTPPALAAAVTEMRLRLLRHYREAGSWTEWDRVYRTVGENPASLSPELTARLRLESALGALFALDPGEAKRQLMNWPADQAIPFWEAKRAGLLAELGESAAALSMLEASLLTIRRQIDQRNYTGDHTLLSQESIVMLLLDTVRRSVEQEGKDEDAERALRELSDRWSELAKYKCDPRREVELYSALLRRRAPRRERSREIGESRRVDLGPDGEALAGFGLLRLCEDTGIPLRVGNASFVSRSVGATLARVAPYSPHWVFVNVVRLGMAKLTDEVLDGGGVAERTRKEVDGLVETYRAALDRTVAMMNGGDWSVAKSYISLANTLPEILSRLCCKCSPHLRTSLVHTLRRIYESERRHVFGGVRSLRLRLLDSMSIEERIAAVPDLLRFPVVEVQYPADEHEFANPLVGLYLPWSRHGDSINVPRDGIDRLLGVVEGSGSGRGWSLTTLGYLHAWGALTEAEAVRFGAALWDEVEGPALPDVRGFSKSDLVKLPHPDNVDVVSAVKTHLLHAVESEPQGSRWYDALREMAYSVGEIHWSESEVARFLARIAAWWGENRERLDDDILGQMTNETTGSLVTALSARVFQSSQDGQKHSEATRKTFANFVSDLRARGVFATRLEVAGLEMLAGSRGDVVRRVADGLLHEDAVCVADAIGAAQMLVAKVADERRQPDTGVVEILELQPVVERFVQGVEWRHAPALAVRLRAAAEIAMTEEWALSDADREALVRGLGHIAEETSRGIIGNDYGSVILIRAAAASLAAALHRHFGKSGSTTPRVLGDWEVACSAPDEFAEVRNGWVEGSET